MLQAPAEGVFLQMLGAPSAVPRVLRTASGPVLLKVFWAPAQHVLGQRFGAAPGVRGPLLLRAALAQGFVVLGARSFECFGVIRGSGGSGFLQMLGAGAAVLGALRAALAPGLLQVLRAATAGVVLVVVRAVRAARAGGAAAVAHVPHAGRRGGGELAQAGLAVDGAAAAHAAGALLLVEQHAELLELHVLLHHLLLLHLQLLQFLQV